MGNENLIENTENLRPIQILSAFRYKLLNHFLRLSFSKYQYDGLPDGITSFAIEEGLYNKGIIGLIKNDLSIKDRYYVLYLAGVSAYDFNGEIEVAGLTGYKTERSVLFEARTDDIDVIFMKNSISNETTVSMIIERVDKLVDIWYSDNINLLQSNKKLVVKGKPEHFNSLIEESFAKLAVSPFIVIDTDDKGYKEWEDNDINSLILNFDITYEPLKYSNHYKTIYTQILNIIGVNHNASQKAERNTSDEVTLDTVETKILNDEMLFFRQDAIRRFNVLYNLSVKVADKYAEIEKEEDPDKTTTVKEDDDDE